MDKRVKILYICTMTAIIGLIAVQGAWLYRQYDYSLHDQERRMFSSLSEMVQIYNDRRKMDKGNCDRTVIRRSNTNINYSRDDDKSQMATVSVLFENRDIRDVLHMDRHAEITDADRTLAHAMVSRTSIDSVKSEIRTVRVSYAPVQTDIWSAADDMVLDYNHPFTLAGIDSVLCDNGINARTELVTTDSIVWQSDFTTNRSLLHPSMRAVFPYNPLERKAVVFVYDIPVGSVVRSMGIVLVLSVLLSLFLMVCLIWQIRTVVHLARIDKMRNSFIHTMIHELKRPVATLKLCVSALDNPKMVTDDATRREITGDCRAAVDNLSTYFSRMRDIMFNESGQIPLNIETCDLRGLVGNVISNLSIPSDKEVRITCGFAGSPSVACDRLHMSQMLGNLIENAVKYSGRSVDIAIGCTMENDAIAISVTDNGIGISEGDCRRVFDKFYRSAGAVESGMPGVGLGLAYVRLLADAHGGTVEVSSRVGHGSVFTIKIPQ